MAEKHVRCRKNGFVQYVTCENDDVAFFFKQWGGTNKKKAGRVLDGQTWDTMPLGNS